MSRKIFLKSLQNFRIIGVQIGSLAFVLRRTLFEESMYSFQIIFALENAGAVIIYTFKIFRRYGYGGAAEASELTLDGTD